MVAIQVYSQQGEQDAILSVVGTSGRFLDIGAFHPTCFSNTRALYEMGWSGVMVEPSPGPFASLFREYGADERVTLVNAALGLERRLARLWVTDDAVSTTEAAQYGKWREAARFTGEMYVPVITLVDLLQFGPFDFVNIDTEGTSVDLLHSVLLMEPRCVCVEFDDRHDEAVAVANDRGYRVVLDNGTNLVLAK